MGSSGILVFTWVAVGLVVAGYIWFIVWRVRADKRKKAAEAKAQQPMRDALRSPVLDTPRPVEPRSVVPPAVQPATAAAVVTEPKAQETVIEALAGIRLPCDLVPLTTMAARPGVGDRIAFWTDAAPAETVGPAFAAELERLGYEVEPKDEARLHAGRGDTDLVVVVHPDPLLATIDDKPAFPSVPERAVVVEAWLTE